MSLTIEASLILKNPLLFSAALIIFNIIGCGTTPNERCQEVDWYEIGRTDGTKGIFKNQRRDIKVQCKDSDVSLAEAFYNNGFDTGMTDSCLPKNGFELGKLSRKVDADNCPPVLRDKFNVAYKIGLKYSEIENDLRVTPTPSKQKELVKLESELNNLSSN
jgi:hypothetical protein